MILVFLSLSQPLQNGDLQSLLHTFDSSKNVYFLTYNRKLSRKLEKLVEIPQCKWSYIYIYIYICMFD